VVGHAGGRRFYGAERSLLDVLAAIDSERYEVTCVLPERSAAEYVAAVERIAPNVTRLPYTWWTLERPVEPAAVQRFESVILEAGWRYHVQKFFRIRG
jgi:hypothetical protein